MATYNKFESFSEYLCEGFFDFNAAGDQIEIYLSNAAPSASLDLVKTDLLEITPANGYTGPQDIQNDLSRTGGTTSLTGVDVTITASGGAINTFQYVVLFNTTPAATPTDPLMGWWDYGSAVNLADGEQFVVDFGTSVVQVS